MSENNQPERPVLYYGKKPYTSPTISRRKPVEEKLPDYGKEEHAEDIRDTLDLKP